MRNKIITCAFSAVILISAIGHGIELGGHVAIIAGTYAVSIGKDLEGVSNGQAIKAVGKGAKAVVKGTGKVLLAIAK